MNDSDGQSLAAHNGETEINNEDMAQWVHFFI